MSEQEIGVENRASHHFYQWHDALNKTDGAVTDLAYYEVLNHPEKLTAPVMANKLFSTIPFIAFNLKGIQGIFITDGDGVTMILMKKSASAFALWLPDLDHLSPSHVFYFKTLHEFDTAHFRMTLLKEYLREKDNAFA